MEWGVLAGSSASARKNYIDLVLDLIKKYSKRRKLEHRKVTPWKFSKNVDIQGKHKGFIMATLPVLSISLCILLFTLNFRGNLKHIKV